MASELGGHREDRSQRIRLISRSQVRALVRPPPETKQNQLFLAIFG